jgi:uncharacterized protein YbjT (DUF2867 family)
MAIRGFVAGATGYVGRAVIDTLAARNIAVTAHVRPDSPSLERFRERFTRAGAAVDTTPWTSDAMSDTMGRLRPTHVFALLGITRARAKERARAGAPMESYDSVDYGLSAMLLAATQRSAPAARFVYLSAIGATESTRNEYLRVRGRLEREIRGSGISALIVRPSFITGPDRDESRPAERIGATVVDAALGIAGLVGARRARDRYRSLTGAQLAEAMVTFALEPFEGVRVVDGVDLWRALRGAASSPDRA